MRIFKQDPYRSYKYSITQGHLLIRGEESMPHVDACSKRDSLSMLVALTSICASLYALGSYATSYIESPWGTGQFRPAIVIPAVFAILFGPIPGAVGAAIGTLLADSFKHGQFYLKSLVAAVPGNLLGFYILGKYLHDKFTWSRYVIASIITLLFANFVVAILAVPVWTAILLPDVFSGFSPVSWLFISLGLTLWWFSTMLPFQLLMTPLLLRSACRAFPSIMSRSVVNATLMAEIPRLTFALALIFPGISFILIGLAASLTPLGGLMSPAFGAGIAQELTLTLVRLMFYLMGGLLTALGVALLTIRFSRRIFGLRK
jgi:uncharacterized membrane protein